MLQDDSMNLPIVMQLPTPSEIGMWDGMEQPEALCLASLSCHGRQVARRMWLLHMGTII